MFDSPFEFCAICRQYVLLDQTQRQCAVEHRCASGTPCPLHRYFTGIEFGRGQAGAEPTACALRPRTRTNVR
jgi:hypothetical protein